MIQEFLHCHHLLRLIHLSQRLNSDYAFPNRVCFIFRSFWNNIGDSGVTSLSEVLKVNSSLTYIELEVTSYYPLAFILFLYHSHGTKLAIQEQRHCLKFLRLIHLSLTWVLERVSCFVSFWFFMRHENNVCDLGLSALSSALEVNSSLIFLNLSFSFPFILTEAHMFLKTTKSVIQVYHHWSLLSRLIQLSLP